VPAEPAAPRVVTRTRRRAASRPAGPPVAVGADQGVAEIDGVGQPGAVEGAVAVATTAADAPVVEHVPVKKRGARKR
jgi:ribonuclease E